MVHGLGFDRDFKGWMGEAWKRELARWFLGPSGRVLGQFFFSNLESRREDRNGGLGSSFRRTDGETREEKAFLAITRASGLGKGWRPRRSS